MPTLRTANAGKTPGPPGSGPYVIKLPGCRPKNPLNGAQGFSRGATIRSARERGELRRLAFLATSAHVPLSQRRRLGAVVIVHLERISPRPYDSDGWQAAAKPLRDGIADAFKRDDKDSDTMVWRYSQSRGVPHFYAVHINIEVL